MTTECYAMVRGSAIRVTGLTACGGFPDVIQSVVAKCVSRVQIDEVVESGGNELLRTDDDDPRIHFARSAETIRYLAGIRFLRVDPELLSLMTGVKVVRTYGTPVPGYGFGEGPFGESSFGGTEGDAGDGNIVGFDMTTRLPAKAFGLEVWTRLTDQSCAGGQRKYGYTLFPFLKGGYLTGFTFANGLVSFEVVGAQTRRNGQWGYGPYDLEGPGLRLVEPVSGNLMWRNFITTAPPPEQTDGIVEFVDVIDNGDAVDPHPLAVGVVDNGTAADPGVGIIDGGAA